MDIMVLSYEPQEVCCSVNIRIIGALINGDKREHKSKNIVGGRCKVRRLQGYKRCTPS
ncbi:MAG: hypothetical protein FGF51_01735 [Candidatus Brockarchaeota archaeon]|nr:hypothetical protein [Candidatus Brockarchaeota archaeon]